jgi:hypothetical protein
MAVPCTLLDAASVSRREERSEHDGRGLTGDDGATMSGHDVVQICPHAHLRWAIEVAPVTNPARRDPEEPNEPPVKRPQPSTHPERLDDGARSRRYPWRPSLMNVWQRRGGARCWPRMKADATLSICTRKSESNPRNPATVEEGRRAILSRSGGFGRGDDGAVAADKWGPMSLGWWGTRGRGSEAETRAHMSAQDDFLRAWVGALIRGAHMSAHKRTRRGPGPTSCAGEGS